MPNPLSGWFNLIIFIPSFFSMGTLLTTFFTPWHRYYWKKKSRGLHIGESFYVLTSNLLSRIIGIILRTVVLIIGSVATIAAIIFGLPLSLLLAVANPKSIIFDQNTLYSQRGFAWDWQYGYTVLIDTVSTDLYNEKTDIPLIGRDDEKDRIARTIASGIEKSILLVGEPGSGRRALLIDLAHEMPDHRFLLLDWVQYFKGITDESEQAAKLEDALFEIQHAGNIVLILPDIHQLVSFSSIFEQYTVRADMHIIGLTTPDNYHTDIFPVKSFMRHFIAVDVNPPTKQQIIEMITARASRSNYSELVSSNIVSALYTASNRLISTEHKHQPEAALSLLGEFEDYIAQQRKDKDRGSVQTLLEHFIEDRIEIPFGSLSGPEKETLKHLEATLHERIVNQTEAIGEIAGALRRRQLQLSSENKPIGSFLFLGPTGVGKTETAKALAALFFRDEKRLIRFDMAQYQHASQMSLLTEDLAQAIRELPYGVLLLDEIEKADANILNLFLSIVDEGYFFDENRNKVLCNNLIIIGTSNAGSEYIRSHLHGETNHSEHKEKFSAQVVEHILHEHIFSPEFLNRFDGVIVYTPLTKADLVEITKMKLNTIQKRLQKKHQKTFTISADLIEYIVEEGAHPEFGARDLDRTIRKLVEDPLAEKLLE